MRATTLLHLPILDEDGRLGGTFGKQSEHRYGAQLSEKAGKTVGPVMTVAGEDRHLPVLLR